MDSLRDVSSLCVELLRRKEGRGERTGGVGEEMEREGEGMRKQTDTDKPKSEWKIGERRSDGRGSRGREGEGEGLRIQTKVFFPNVPAVGASASPWGQRCMRVSIM